MFTILYIEQKRNCKVALDGWTIENTEIFHAINDKL
jgi:hypothetical protein